MPKIKFDFAGQTFKADVADSFLQRDKSEQGRILKEQLISKYETRIPPRGSEEKGVLDYLGLIERPAQALKVGLKESELGGNVFRALGGVDLTPEEGFVTGISRGWLGEDEVRTQDFLPDNMDPLIKGILGFAGDVATDPVTWYAPAIVGATGRAIKAHTPKGVVNVLNKAKDGVMDMKFGEGQRGLADIARAMNVPVGEGRKAYGTAQVANKILRERDKEISEHLPKLEEYFKGTSEKLGVPIAQVERLFADTLERPAIWDEELEQFSKVLMDVSEDTKGVLGDDGMKLLREWEGRERKWLDESAAFGQPIEELKSLGYFPRVITDKGRDLLESQKVPFLADMEIDELGNLVYRAGYRGPREFMPGETVSKVNEVMSKAMAEAAGSKKPNPMDIPYEFQFFQQKPTLALGERWSRQNKALQRRWFIDEITDASRATGPMLSNTIMDTAKANLVRKGMRFPSVGAQLSEALRIAPVKTEMGIGKWIKRDPDGKDGEYIERFLNPEYEGLGRGEQYLWRQADNADIRTNYSEVKGIPNQILSDEVLDKEWVRVWTEELRLRGLGRFGGGSPGRVGRLSDDEIKKLPPAYTEVRDLADAAVAKLELDNRAMFIAPKQVTRQIEDHLSLMSGDTRGESQIKNFLKFYDRTQNAWKAWTLGVRPAYHSRNALGNILNAYTITGLGENIPEAVRIFTAAAKLQYYSRFRGDPAKQAEVLNNMKGLRLQFEKVPKQLEDGLWTAGNYEDTGFSMAKIYEAALDRGVNAGHYTADNIRDVKRAMEAEAKVGSKLERTIGAENPAVRMGFALGGTIEGNARFAVFLNTLRNIRKNPGEYKWTTPDGDQIPIQNTDKYFKTTTEYDDIGTLRQRREAMTEEDMIFDIASQEVKAGLFDYSDVSRFERDVLKRFMPFYTWTRKNIPAQLKSLVLNPQRAEKLHLAKEQFEHETGDLDYSDYGKFWGDRVPVFLGRESEGVVKAFTMLNIVPMSDLQRLLKPGPLLAEMTTPWLKTPLESLANYDTFRKKPIKAFEGEAKDYFGVNLPPRLWHLAQIIVPLTELNRLNPAGVFGERLKDEATGMITSTAAYGGLGAMRETAMDAPEIARWIRFFSGGAVWDVDLHKHRYIENRNLKKDRAELKGKMKWAYNNSQNERAGSILEVLEALDRQEITDPFDRR